MNTLHFQREFDRYGVNVFFNPCCNKNLRACLFLNAHRCILYSRHRGRKYRCINFCSFDVFMHFASRDTRSMKI